MAAAAGIYDLSRLAFVFISLLLLVTIFAKSTLIVVKCLKWTLPFAVPLIAIHGILNPTFGSTWWLWDTVPVRQDGIAYGLLVSGRIGLLTLAVTCWLPIPRETIFESVVRLRSIPVTAAMVLLQAVSMVGLIKRRIEMVRLAQRSRGVAFGPSVYVRVKATPALTIPVIVTTIVDANARAIALMTRGLGSGPMEVPYNASSGVLGEWLLGVTSLAVFILAAVV